jgi:hypothetical protein
MPEHILKDCPLLTDLKEAWQENITYHGAGGQKQNYMYDAQLLSWKTTIFKCSITLKMETNEN